MQRRVPRRARALPLLQIVEASRLRPHEDADPARVRRLVEVLERDGVLRNPPVVGVVSPGNDELIVLDGANRVAALRAMGAPHVAVQIVRYDGSDVTVSSWTHSVRLDPGPALAARLGAQGVNVAAVADAAEADRVVRQRGGVAAVVDAATAAVVGPGLDPNDGIGLLHALVRVYAASGDVYRLDAKEVDLNRIDGTPGRTALVLFPPFQKADVLRLVAGGARLPAGITRHVIRGRALRCNVPLSWLGSAEPTAMKQARLDEAVEARWRAHGIRYYAEPTYLFDE